MFMALIFIILGPAADYGDFGRWLLLAFTISMFNILDSGHFYDALPSVNSLLGSAIRFYGRYRCTSPVLFLCRLK